MWTHTTVSVPVSLCSWGATPKSAQRVVCGAPEVEICGLVFPAPGAVQFQNKLTSYEVSWLPPPECLLGGGVKS